MRAHLVKHALQTYPLAPEDAVLGMLKDKEDFFVVLELENPWTS
jgi:hypothetical protein